MAVVVDQKKLATFEGLFAQPSIEGMLALSWQDFQDFVQYVFECAGYAVENVANQFFPNGPGVDLNLYAGKIGGKPVARVEVKKYDPANLVDAGQVMAFIGKLQVAGGTPGYLVTTSGFGGPAKAAADGAQGKVHLLDSRRFLRYIAYVGGSRLAGEYAGARVGPAEPVEPTILMIGEDLAKRGARPPRLTRILAVGNNKGGVAKTTTALNLGFALAEQYKQRVLLVDMDGQASLTRSLPQLLPKGAPKDAAAPLDQHTLAKYFRGQTALGMLARPTRFGTLSLIPAHADLLRLDSGGSARPRAELEFVRDLHALAAPAESGISAYDWVILDTPPAQSFFTRVALAAADHILIPTVAETYAVHGVKALLGTARTMHALTGDLDGWRQKVLGCLVTRWKPNKNAEVALATLRTDLDAVGVRPLGVAIPADDKVEQAVREVAGGKLKHIFKLANSLGPAAQAYEKLAKELL
jgi:cellulose biosynthesis protein BcsQ